MRRESTYLTINSHPYSREQLVVFCHSKLSDSQSSSFDNHLYSFILNFISENPDVIVKTSGSTGKPKEVKLSKDAMIESAKMTGEFFGLKRGDKALLCLPTEFIAGKMMVVRAVALGLNLIHIPPTSNPLKEIDETFDFAAMTPMQVHNVLFSDAGYKKLNRIKNLIIGGGDIGEGLLKEIRKLENKTFHTYGMTETITHIALKRLNGTHPDTCFKALGNITFEKNEKGCLVINALHLSDIKIVTNDIVDLKSKTEFNFTGRLDNVINTGGIKVFPEEVEKKISGLINERFVIAGLPDDKYGEKVVLIVETATGKKEKFEKTVLNSALSGYENPKDIFFVEKFPETEGGKIDRKKLIRLIG